MTNRVRLFFLSTVLAVDILFFIIIGRYYPEGFTRTLELLPFNNGAEAAAIILGGLFVATLCGILLVRVVLGELGEVFGDE